MPEFGTIADAPSNWTTYDEMERLKKADIKQKQLEKEAAERDKGKTPNSVREAFKAANFICGSVVIPRADEGSIQKHQRLCSICWKKAEIQKIHKG